MPFIAHPAIRNRGTIGGSLAHADPAAELPAVMLALDARVWAEPQTATRVVAASGLFYRLCSQRRSSLASCSLRLRFRDGRPGQRVRVSGSLAPARRFRARRASRPSVDAGRTGALLSGAHCAAQRRRSPDARRTGGASADRSESRPHEAIRAAADAAATAGHRSAERHPRVGAVPAAAGECADPASTRAGVRRGPPKRTDVRISVAPAETDMKVMRCSATGQETYENLRLCPSR